MILPNEGSSTLRRKLVSMYLAGYNIIHLKVKSSRISPALRDAVREVIRRNLVGTEMISDARLTAYNAAGPVVAAGTFGQHRNPAHVPHRVVYAQRRHDSLG